MSLDMLTERETLAYSTLTLQRTLSMFMLMLTLPVVTTPEDPPPVTLFYSITAVSPGSQRNKPLSLNQQLKQNSLLCHTVLAIFDGFSKALLTFASMFQSLCTPITPVQIPVPARGIHPPLTVNLNLLFGSLHPQYLE